jgi:hypothetical protein
MTLRVGQAPENASAHGQETVTFRDGVVPVPGRSLELNNFHQATYALHRGLEPQIGGEVNVGYDAGLPNLKGKGKGWEIQ